MVDGQGLTFQEESIVQNISISRYNPALQSEAKWSGNIEPEDRSWILFVDTDNVPHLYLHRDIGVAEAKDRGLTPKDPETGYGVGGEYLEAGNFPKDEKPTPNQPLVPS